MDIFKNLWRIFFFFVVIFVAASLFGAYFYFMQNSENNEFIEVTRGTVMEEVVATGQVKPVTSVVLAFENGGRVARIFADVGSRVGTGMPLVELDHGDLDANFQKAEAQVKAQGAKLAELKRGTRLEEIAIQEVRVKNAQSALVDAKRNLLDKLEDAYTKSDDAVRNKTDQMINNARGASPSLIFSPADARMKSDIENMRISVESLLSSWPTMLLRAGQTEDLNPYAATTSQNFEIIKNYLDKMTYALSTASAGTSFSQATLDSWRTDVSSARTNINTAIANRSAAVEKVRVAEANLSLEQNELVLGRAGATPEQIMAQEAAVDEARAAVANASSKLAKAVLRAPVAGIVTRQDAKIGEIIASNIIIVGIISENAFEIEVNIPEVDVGRIKIGNSVSITYDAFPGKKVGGKLIHIDPAETIIDGVINFKVKIVADARDVEIRSGLTANCSIEARKKENVLYLPQYALSEKEEGTYVKKINGNSVMEVPVVIGIRGTDGIVEIISGVSEGDRVLNVGLKNGGQ